MTSKSMRKLFHKTSTKITLGIVLITTILLGYISFFSIMTAQSEFQSATVKFIDGNIFLVKQSPVAPVDVIKDQFSEKLINTLLLAGFMGIILAVITGIIFSLVITQPLRQIKYGINNLKKSKYKNKLRKTGESEFDEVIEEFNDLAEELEYQEDLRRDLISDVAHELKTPLTSILGQVQGMRDKVLTIDDRRLETIQQDAERLTQLIEMLQENTKLRSRIPNISVELIELRKVVDYLRDSNIRNLQDKNIKIINEIPSNFVIEADSMLIERIFQNIIDNAIKYSQGTKIKIYIENSKLIISDNGIGIDEEHLRKIFERFYRVEKSRNRKTGGLGLGLSLVKEMVEAHGWEIEARNNEQNKGTRFVIDFHLKFAPNIKKARDSFNVLNSLFRQKIVDMKNLRPISK